MQNEILQRVISRAVRLLVVAVAAVAALTGCDVETFDDAVSRIPEQPAPLPPPPGSPPPPPPPPPPAAGFGPNFSEIQASVLTPDCATSGCHAGGNPPAGLNLEEANSYAMLVGIQSSQDAGFQRVEAGDPDNSYLVRKLEGTASSGQQMPPGAPLPQSEIDVIRQWIRDGAIDDTAVPPQAPITVTSLSPTPNAALVAAPPTIVVGFSRELDQTSIGPSTFLLTGSGGDGDFANGSVPITPVSVTVGTNPMSAIMDLTGVPMNDDTYRVTLVGSGNPAIMDLDGNLLDGEYLNRFPTGDGVAGGDFVVEFTLVSPLGATLDEIQERVFTPTCATTSCHTGANPSGGLDLTDADTSHAALVDMPSSVGTLLVAPGLPNESYLVQKLEGTAGGARMPLGGAPLDPTEIAAIRQWIMDGAAR